MNASAVIPFQFQQHQVRAVAIDGEPWFVAKDVCAALGLENVTKALQRIPERHLTLNRIQGADGRVREINIISEPGLYRLVLRSDKPQAEPFMEWVTAEVLPTIRKTGAYVAPSTAIAIPLLPETLALKPSMRQRLWSDALQAARLDGQSTTEAVAWFAELCRMMAARPNVPAASESLTRFIDECLEEAKGWNTPFRDILAAFHRWWAAGGLGHPPSPKTLAVAVGWHFERYKSSGMVYRNCRLRPATVKNIEAMFAEHQSLRLENERLRQNNEGLILINESLRQDIKEARHDQ